MVAILGLLAVWMVASSAALWRVRAFDARTLEHGAYAVRSELGVLACAAFLAFVMWQACTVAATIAVRRLGIADPGQAAVLPAVLGLLLPIFVMLVVRPILVRPAGPTRGPDVYEPASTSRDGVIDYAVAPTEAPKVPVWRSVLQGLAGLLMAAPFVYATMELTARVLQWFHVNIPVEHELIRLLKASPALAPLVFLSAGVLAPIFEELLFRGTVQSFLSALFVRMGPRNAAGGRWMAITITSLLFAALHPAFSWPAIFVLSLGLGLLYERTGRLLPCVTMHAGFNLISLIATVAGWN
jgi:membrane protease YdiL (CAAX protease family)